MSRIVFLSFLAAVTHAATLKPEALEVWNQYFSSAEAKLSSNRSFLWIDQNPGLKSRVQSGEIVVAETNSGSSKKAPNSLIHDWTGAAFIPGAKVDDVVSVVRNYSRYKDYYAPTVLRSQTLEKSGDKDRFSIVMMNQSLLRIAIQTDCQATYTQVSDKRWYAISSATKIQEIENYGASVENRTAAGQGGGYLWRLASITHFEERDGGVYIEVEALALSRDIPAALRFFVEPIVRRMSRNSLAESLEQTGKAVNQLMAANRNDQLARRIHSSAVLGMAITNP